MRTVTRNYILSSRGVPDFDYDDEAFRQAQDFVLSLSKDEAISVTRLLLPPGVSQWAGSQ